MKTKKIDEFQLENLIYSFIYEDESARKISTALKKVDLEDFYQRFVSKFRASEKPDLLESMVDFISYVIFKKEFIPGKAGLELAYSFINRGDLSGEFINKMTNVDGFRFKDRIVQGFYNMEGFFSRDQKMKIQAIIISKDFFLIFTLFQRIIGQVDIDRMIQKVILAENIYLSWGMLQLFLELGDVSLEPYLDQISGLEDPILNNRISLYKELLNRDFEQFEEEESIEYEEGQEIPIDPCDFIYFVSQLAHENENTIYNMEKIQAKREEILAQLDKL